MKYFVTNYKNQESKEDLRCLGLYCYSLRSKDDSWSEIATIENNVLINRYGSIITNEEIKLGKSYPNDFLDFNEFESKNEKVNSISELKKELEYVKDVDLSEDNKVEEEFFALFEDNDDFEELEKMTIKDKYEYFMNYYDNLNDYQLVEMGGHIYQLFHINLDNKGEEND